MSTTTPTTTTAPPATKTCPTCGREIKEAAIVCRHCGHEFGAAAPAKARRGRRAKAAKPEAAPLAGTLLAVHTLAAGAIVLLTISGLQANSSSPRWRFAATWEDGYTVYTWRLGLAALILPFLPMGLANIRHRLRNGLAAALWIAGAAAFAVLFLNWRNDATGPVTIQPSGYAIAAAFCVGILASLGLFLATLRRRGGERSTP